MPRSTIIFGNGLGMAVAPDYFGLSTALREVWSGSDDFHPIHKRLVRSAIPGLTENDFPQTEEQLDQLQVALVAAQFLREFETDDVKWLAQEAQGLPEAFKRFIHEVASYFHESAQVLPFDFTQSLSRYLNDTKSHVATLNYDNLLYDALTNSGVLSGYRGALIDGFLRDGFDNENLKRLNPARLGWYLHLHGSPLFIGNRKMMGEGRHLFQPDETSHIVLTHVKHKPLVIERSDILSAYWIRFHEALAESSRIVLFGCSGEDVHLNQSIADRIKGRSLLVIEWEGTGDFNARTAYWKLALKSEGLRVVQMPNILEYRSWSDP